MNLTNAMELPEVTWEYWGIIETMQSHPGLYTLDDMRSKCHDRLCKEYGINKKDSRKVTDHLDKYQTAVDMHDAFIELIKYKEAIK